VFKVGRIRDGGEDKVLCCDEEQHPQVFGEEGRLHDKTVQLKEEGTRSDVRGVVRGKREGEEREREGAPVWWFYEEKACVWGRVSARKEALSLGSTESNLGGCSTQWIRKYSRFGTQGNWLLAPGDDQVATLRVRVADALSQVAGS
jgi:hypothetical protein